MTEPRYLEDFRFGETFETDSYRITFDEAVGFAEVHDPQSFHIDEAEAQAHPIFGGLSASGFFTMSVTHRLILDAEIGHAWGLIGKGIDKLRWPRPVRPGDTLHVRGRVIGVSRDPRQPFGIVQVAVETLNQDGDAVMSMTVHTVVPSRVALVQQKAAA